MRCRSGSLLATAATSLLSAAFLVSGTALAQELPESEEDKTLYFLGVVMARTLDGQFHLKPGEVERVLQGLKDSIAGEAMELDARTYQGRLQALSRARIAKAAEEEKLVGTELLAKAAAEEGAVRTDSGLVITEVQAGSGSSPQPTDTVKVHYHGTLRDGTVFDSSVERGTPQEFPLNRVIPCWTEALQRMKVGGRSTIFCPPDIAYGDRGMPPDIPGGSVLRFEVELLEILD
jgi:FKBP-type peptidyl-prolyl cis-trans isomerase